MSETKTEPKKFTFGKAGAPASTPVESPAAAPADAAGQPANGGAASQTSPQNLPATQSSQPPAFYTGDEETPVDAGDVRWPRLNIVQKSSGADLLKLGFGSLVLKQKEVLTTPDAKSLPARLVVIGARPKIWIEKVKFGTQGKIARSEDEVVQLGGSSRWAFSKENPKNIGSTKSWFQPSVTLFVLVQKPENAPEDNFPYEADGKLYAAALLSVKSTNYDAFFGAIQSEKVTGVLRGGYNTRFIDANIIIKPFSGGESGVFKLSFAEPTTDAVKALCKQALGN